MPYKKGTEWSGNKSGRPTAEERATKFTKRELKDRELLMVLRKIRPHVSDSIISAATIMKNPNAQDASKLKAATILLDNYRKLVLDLYEGQDEDEGTEVQQENRPIFSLRVVEEDKPAE